MDLDWYKILYICIHLFPGETSGNTPHIIQMLFPVPLIIATTSSPCFPDYSIQKTENLSGTV